MTIAIYRADGLPRFLASSACFLPGEIPFLVVHARDCREAYPCPKRRVSIEYIAHFQYVCIFIRCRRLASLGLEKRPAPTAARGIPEKET